MKQYFLIQCKRFFRILPAVLVICAILLTGFACGVQLLLRNQANQEQNQKLHIAVVGSTEDPILSMGVTALTFYDSSRFSMDVIELTEEQAQKALFRGEISAYVVIPENFVEEAYYGNFLPLKFVSTVGANGLLNVFKTEITSAISKILLDAQKGVYGIWYATQDYNIPLDNQMEIMPLEYTEYVFLRSNLYAVTDLGISDGLNLVTSIGCGFGVLFLMMCTLPFAPLLIQRDDALAQMLSSRGRPLWKQKLCDFAVYAVSLLLVLLLLLTIATAMFFDVMLPYLNFGNLLRLILATVLIAATSYFLYCLASDLVGGILLQFFLSLALCFVSGCLFPAYFFPGWVQKTAQWLPAGIARAQIAGCLDGTYTIVSWLLALGYSAAFFCIGYFVTHRRMKEVHR